MMRKSCQSLQGMRSGLIKMVATLQGDINIITHYTQCTVCLQVCHANYSIWLSLQKISCIHPANRGRASLCTELYWATYCVGVSWLWWLKRSWWSTILGHLRLICFCSGFCCCAVISFVTVHFLQRLCSIQFVRVTVWGDDEARDRDWFLVPMLDRTNRLSCKYITKSMDTKHLSSFLARFTVKL